MHDGHDPAIDPGGDIPARDLPAPDLPGEAHPPAPPADAPAPAPAPEIPECDCDEEIAALETAAAALAAEPRSRDLPALLAPALAASASAHAEASRVAAAVKARIDADTARVTAAEARVTAAEGRVDALQAALNDSQDALSAARQEVAALSGAVSSLAARVVALETTPPPPPDEEEPDEEEPPPPDPDPEPEPDPGEVPAITGLRADAEDDYAVLRFDPVPGAVDYVARVNGGAWQKASAGLPAIELPGLHSDPDPAVELVALDGFAPFEELTPSSDFSRPHTVNGHGEPVEPGSPPGANPRVIAASVVPRALLATRPHPARSAPGLVYFEDFRTPHAADGSHHHEAAWARGPVPAGWERATGAPSLQNEHYSLLDPQGRFRCLCFATNADPERTFVMRHKDHLEAQVADGGTPPAVTSNNYSALYLERVPTADSPVVHGVIDAASGRFLEFGFVLNPLHNGRRWVEVTVKRRGNRIVEPNRTQEIPPNRWYPTVEENPLVRVVLRGPDSGQGGFAAELLTRDPATGLVVTAATVPHDAFEEEVYGDTWRGRPNPQSEHGWNRNHWDSGPNFDALTDIGAKFAVRVSARGVRLYERSPVDGRVHVIAGDWPGGLSLPDGEYEVGVTLMVYHTINDVREITQWAAGAYDYWLRRTPHHMRWHTRSWYLRSPEASQEAWDAPPPGM